jgi:hypothetical protein
MLFSIQGLVYHCLQNVYILLSRQLELNRNLLYWYFQENQCLNIKKHAVHNIHRLTWGLRVTPQHAHALRQ